MSKKRISSREANRLARGRMSILMDLAIKMASEGNAERSRNYVRLAKRIGMRTKTRMLKEHLYCRECDIALIPGKNCVVRLRGEHVTTRCLDCGFIRRFPYSKEKRMKHGEKEGTS